LNIFYNPYTMRRIDRLVPNFEHFPASLLLNLLNYISIFKALWSI
jgi:uncharacterized membrane protein